MKKLLLFTTSLFLLIISAQAQLPFGTQFGFEFTGGSNSNVISGSVVSDLSNDGFGGNSIISTADRTASAGDAADLIEVQFAFTNSLMATNTLTTGLSFWVRSNEQTSAKRILQMYNSNGRGYRIEMDGSNIIINATMYDLYPQVATFTMPAVLDDTTWHHIVVTTLTNSSQNVIGFGVYVDNVEVGVANNNLLTGLGSTINEFLQNPNFTLDPLGNFGGDIDDIYFYTRSLSPAEVTTLYNHYPGQTAAAGVLDTLYVNPTATGLNDGSTWANAYTDARDAFIDATKLTEIWVAEGTYIRNSTDRNTIFGWTVDSVMVYGGFAGGELTRDNRDWDAHPTIFSGDIGTVGDNSDNAYSVFVGPIGSQTYSLIDGIKITGGNANTGSYGNFSYNGGALALDALVDIIELNNIEIYDNYANTGGAIDFYSYANEPTTLKMNNIIAHNNNSISAPFAHIRSAAGGKITLEMTNCLIYENEATGTTNSGSDFGTVMFLGSNSGATNGINATITNCTFAFNEYPQGHSSKGMIRTYGAANSITSLNFTNNICFGNYIAEISNKNYANTVDAFGTVNLKNNIIDYDIDFTATTDVNTLSVNPLFNSNYTLLLSSPAINAGTQTGVTLPMYDLAGNARVAGAEVDLGCYEFSCDNITTTLSLNNNEFSVTGGVSFTWYLDNSDLNLNSSTSTYAPTQDGGYYVIGTGTDGCSDTSNVISYCSSFTLTISQNGTTLTADAGYSNYQWLLDGVAISGATSETYTVTQTGDYTCEAENNGCVGTSNNITVDLGTAIRDVAFENLSVYPNPTNGIVNIQVRESLTSIKLMDLSGRTIQDYTPNTSQVNLGDFTPGIYLLEIANAQNRTVIKIVKQ